MTAPEPSTTKAATSDARALAATVDRVAEIDPEWRIKELGLEAKLAARADDLRDRVPTRDDALAVAGSTDFVSFHADALLDGAEVCRLDGRLADAESAAQGALQLFESKGNLAGAAKARALLAPLK